VLSYRTAFWGLLFCCIVGIVIWGVAMGTSWWWCWARFVIFIFRVVVMRPCGGREGGVIMAEEV